MKVPRAVLYDLIFAIKTEENDKTQQVWDELTHTKYIRTHTCI